MIYRNANVIISLVIVVLAAFVALGAYIKEIPPLSFLPRFHVVVIAAFLVRFLNFFGMQSQASQHVSPSLQAVASGYKLIFYYSTSSPISVGTKLGFYFLSPLPEFCACMLLFSIAVVTNCQIQEARQKQMDDTTMRAGNYVGLPEFGYDDSQAVYPPQFYCGSGFYGGNTLFLKYSSS